MTRLALFAALVTGLLSAGSSRADVEVAPPPRPKGVPFKPPAPAAKAEDPTETVGKIIKNTKDVTERLAKSDGLKYFEALVVGWEPIAPLRRPAGAAAVFAVSSSETAPSA